MHKRLFSTKNLMKNCKMTWSYKQTLLEYDKKTSLFVYFFKLFTAAYLLVLTAKSPASTHFKKKPDWCVCESRTENFGLFGFTVKWISEKKKTNAIYRISVFRV